MEFVDPAISHSVSASWRPRRYRWSPFGRFGNRRADAARPPNSARRNTPPL